MHENGFPQYVDCPDNTRCDAQADRNEEGWYDKKLEKPDDSGNDYIFYQIIPTNNNCHTEDAAEIIIHRSPLNVLFVFFEYGKDFFDRGFDSVFVS